ncbi:hypothetical protein C8R46DRAFT_1060152, partial [Mycena filopes]
MRFVVFGLRRSLLRPTSAAPRPLAQLSSPPASSILLARPRHPHARSSTHGYATSDSRRSLGSSRAGVRGPQCASGTRGPSPWCSRTRRIWPRCRYDSQNNDSFLTFDLDSRSRARRSAPNVPICFFPSSSLSLSPQIPVVHKYLSSLIPTTPGLITLVTRYLPHYPLLYMVWDL